MDVRKVTSQTADDLCAVERVNWPESYPDRPNVKFAIAHTGGEILLRYVVEEECALGRVTEDNGRVWTDSCVEFFVSFDDTGYYNFEFNCLGTMLLCFGQGRGDSRIEASSGTLGSVRRRSSLGSEPFGLRCGGVRWELEARIPVKTFFAHNIETLDGLRARANFYKCGDDLPQPHFLSWQPIDTPCPDFHRPEFFGELRFG